MPAAVAGVAAAVDCGSSEGVCVYGLALGTTQDSSELAVARKAARHEPQNKRGMYAPKHRSKCRRQNLSSCHTAALVALEAVARFTTSLCPRFS